MRKNPENRIALLREKRGLTQAQLAERLTTHVMTVSKLERGRMRLTTDWVLRISEALEVNPADLLTAGGLRPIKLIGSIAAARVTLFERESILKKIDYGSDDVRRVANDYFAVEDDSLEPFYFKRDILDLALMFPSEFVKLVGRLGVIYSEDTQVFGVLHRHVSGSIFHVKLLDGSVIKNVDVQDFAMIVGHEVPFPMQETTSRKVFSQSARKTAK